MPQHVGTTADEIHERAKRVAAILTLPWLTAQEAAFVVGCHPTTVRRACCEGTLEAVRVGNGRLWRIRPAALDRWLTLDQKRLTSSEE